MRRIKGLVRVYMVDSKANPRTHASYVHWHTWTISWWIQIRSKFLNKVWEDFHYTTKATFHQLPLLLNILSYFMFFYLLSLLLEYYPSLILLLGNSFLLYQNPAEKSIQLLWASGCSLPSCCFQALIIASVTLDYNYFSISLPSCKQ